MSSDWTESGEIAAVPLLTPEGARVGVFPGPGAEGALGELEPVDPDRGVQLTVEQARSLSVALAEAADRAERMAAGRRGGEPHQ